MKRHPVAYIVTLMVFSFIMYRLLVVNEQTWGIIALYGLSGWAAADIWSKLWDLIFGRIKHGETD